MLAEANQPGDGEIDFDDFMALMQQSTDTRRKTLLGSGLLESTDARRKTLLGSGLLNSAEMKTVVAPPLAAPAAGNRATRAMRGGASRA